MDTMYVHADVCARTDKHELAQYTGMAEITPTF